MSNRFLTIKTDKGNNVYRSPFKFRIIGYKWSSINTIANQIPWWPAEKKDVPNWLKVLSNVGRN